MAFDGIKSGNPMSTAQVLDAVAEFESLSQAIANNFHVLSVDNAKSAYAVIERARKRLALVDTAYIVTLSSVLPASTHRRVAWLAQEQRISRAEARQRVSVVDRLREEPEPFASARADVRMPVLRSKVNDGVIGADAVQKIDKAIRDLPITEHAQISRLMDEHVSDVVDKLRVDDLNQLPFRLKGMLGIDDPYTDEDRARKRSLKLGAQGPDGMSSLSGHITPSLAAVLKRLQADHARPGGLLEEGAEDDRSPEQRFHDAVEAAVNAGFRPGGELKPARGTTSIVTVAHIADVAALTDSMSMAARKGNREINREAQELTSNAIQQSRGDKGGSKGSLCDGIDFTLPGSGKAVTDTGIRMSVSEAVQAAVAKNSFLQVLGDEGQTLYLGRSRRLGTLAQYLALLGEEGGSSAPGMATPPAMCDVHHIQAWAVGGGTDLSNLTLVDAGTHRKIDDGRKRETSWWTLRPDEVPGHKARVGGPGINRVVWVPPISENLNRHRIFNAETINAEASRADAVNEDPSTFDNPGRWLRRKARERLSNRNKERGEQNPRGGP